MIQTWILLIMVIDFKVLDVAWQEWSGTKQLINALDRRRFVLKRISFLKAVNVKPDIFKYCVFIEIAGQESSISNITIIFLPSTKL